MASRLRGRLRRLERRENAGEVVVAFREGDGPVRVAGRDEEYTEEEFRRRWPAGRVIAWETVGPEVGREGSA